MIVVCVVLSFALMIFFAGTETAICSLTSFEKKEIARKGGLSAKALSGFLKNPHRVLSSILIGNALSIVFASVSVQLLSVRIAYSLGLSAAQVSVYASAVLFVFVVFFGEIVPKTTARKAPKKFCERTLPFLKFFSAILYPLAVSFYAASRFAASLAGVKLSKSLPRTSSQEFASVTEIAFLSGKISKEEKRMIKGILEFPTKEVRQVMVPEVEIDAVDINWSREKILEKIAAFNHSRIPVYSGSLDNIVGLLYTKDILSVLSFENLLLIKDILRPPSFVPETAPVSMLLRSFMNGRQHLSIVVDEYGKVTGLITLEDVLEEVTGDILDEFDRDISCRKFPDGSFVVAAYEDVDRINEKLSISLPADLADSLGGLILEKLNYLPKKGEKVSFGKVTLVVESADRQRIKTVRIRVEQ
ncbi:MAG: HlyC/CorC family transporter [Elusimicrobia bacterium]|nr:HlyC/CorC family transporter [Elusimicrobiota bacterium]